MSFPDTVISSSGDGNTTLFVSDQCSTLRVIRDGWIWHVTGPLGGRLGLNGPRGMISYDWGVIVADFWSNRMVALKWIPDVDQSSARLIPFQTEGCPLSRPHCLAQHPRSRDLWICDESGLRLVVIKNAIIESFINQFS